MAKRIPRVTDPTKPPQGAVHFDVWRLHKQEGVNKSGGRYTTWKPKRMTGGVGADGRVSDRWLVSELSPEAILARWGSGRYRIRYLGSSYDLVGSVDWELQAPPERTGEPLAPADGAPGASTESPASRLRGVAGRLDGAGVVELMLLLQDSADRSRAAALAEGERNAARDRMFFQQQQEQWRQMLTMTQGAPSAAAAAAPAVDMARELALLRRELSLTVREETARLRAEVLSQIPEETDDPGAETLSEALNGAGVAVVEGVGAEMPPIVGEALGALRGWLRSKGQPTTPEAIASVIEAVRQAAEAQANGQQQ